MRSIEIGEGWTGVLHGELELGSTMAGDNGGLGGRKGLRPAPFIDATRGGGGSGRGCCREGRGRQDCRTWRGSDSGLAGVSSRGDGGAAWQARNATGEQVWGKPGGRGSGFGLGLGTCPPRWPAPAYGVAGGRGAGRKEVEDSVKCSFVIKPNCSVPCKLKFSPCSRGQTKTFEYHFCSVF